MKFNIISLVLFVFTIGTNAQQFFNGEWSFTSGRVSFNLKIIQTNDSIKGNHCSVFNNGEAIDCADIGDITFTGKAFGDSTIVDFISTFSLAYGKASIKRINDNSILWEIVLKPQAIFYIPDKVILSKM